MQKLFLPETIVKKNFIFNVKCYEFLYEFLIIKYKIRDIQSSKLHL